jgi:hypothetical protein
MQSVLSGEETNSVTSRPAKVLYSVQVHRPSRRVDCDAVNEASQRTLGHFSVFDSSTPPCTGRSGDGWELSRLFTWASACPETLLFYTLRTLILTSPSSTRHYYSSRTYAAPIRPSSAREASPPGKSHRKSNTDKCPAPPAVKGKLQQLQQRRDAYTIRSLPRFLPRHWQFAISYPRCASPMNQSPVRTIVDWPEYSWVCQRGLKTAHVELHVKMFRMASTHT